MKTTTKLMIFAAACMLSQLALAQVDEERMERDLKVAENILSTLSDEGGRGWFSNDIESTYIKDYGVVFTLPRRSFVYGIGKDKSIIFSSGGDGVTVIGEKSKGKAETKYRVKAKTIASSSDLEEEDAEKLTELVVGKTREKMTTFLADYADLIGQLQPSDRIIVQTNNNSNSVVMWNSQVRKSGSDNMSAQIMKSDIIEYKKGKIDRDELIARIKFTENEAEDVAKDVELFATLFARLYQPDMSDTYYSASRNISYTKIENIGISFNMKVYSSSNDGGVYTIRATGESDLSQEERDKIVEEMYPDFLKSFKENIVDYARTIRSLEKNELLMFKVKLTECRDCKMPAVIEVSIKADKLKAYDSGKLSREQAIAAIDVKEMKD